MNSIVSRRTMLALGCLLGTSHLLCHIALARDVAVKEIAIKEAGTDDAPAPVAIEHALVI